MREISSAHIATSVAFYSLYFTYCKRRNRKWSTYDYQENEVYPVPEGVGVLHVIHYVRPSFQTNYLQINTIALLGITREIVMN